MQCKVRRLKVDLKSAGPGIVNSGAGWAGWAALMHEGGFASCMREKAIRDEQKLDKYCLLLLRGSR